MLMRVAADSEKAERRKKKEEVVTGV